MRSMRWYRANRNVVSRRLKAVSQNAVQFSTEGLHGKRSPTKTEFPYHIHPPVFNLLFVYCFQPYGEYEDVNYYYYYY